MTSPSTAEPERTAGDSSSRTREDAEQLLRRLSPREVQALARFAAGDDPRTLARNLGVAPGTARAHLNRATRKLGARSHEEAAALLAALARPADRPPKRGPAGTAPPAEPGTRTSPDAASPDSRKKRAPAEAAPPAKPETRTPPDATSATTTSGPPKEHGPAGTAAPAKPGTGTSPDDRSAPPRSPKGGSVEISLAPAKAATPDAPSAATASRRRPRKPAKASAARPAHARTTSAATPEPVGATASDAPSDTDAVPAAFAEFTALVHTRLVQQTFLLTGHRHRAVHCVHLALGAAGRRWAEVSATADPEGWVRSAAFDLALSPWHRGGPRRARVLRARRRIKVAEPVVPEPPTRLTPRDRALLKALQRLSRPRRRALVLHDTLGLSVEQLALEGESSTAAAEARVRSARASLAREVPALVGPDPEDPEFVERLGELLHRAAVHGCPGPWLPPPALLVADSRLRSGLLTAAAAALTVVVGAAVATTLLGVGPADLLRAGSPDATACTAAGSGSAGPAAAGGAPGLQTPWCGPTPGVPARLVGPPARVLPSVEPSDDRPDDADDPGSADALPPGPFVAHRPLLVRPSAHRPPPPPLAHACAPFTHCRPRRG
ncbi:LuxR C-terminal-related transcriptional regulator [Kitasatospora sp. NPDC092948]|uniref:LuxR C-terminal-related transcriptional regulator n=1 Tax=Kitasatospora sp. NPDC092948 TaxID=3364088 RepID=UPI00381221ED